MSAKRFLDTAAMCMAAIPAGRLSANENLLQIYCLKKNTKSADPAVAMSKAGRRLGSPKVSSIDLSFHLCSQVQADHQPVRPPKLSLLRDPGLPSQPFKGPRTAFHGQLATLGQSLDTAVTLQGQVQAVLAAKAVTSKGSRTALATLQRATHSFAWAACDFRSKLGHSCDTPGASTGSFGGQSCHF